MECLSERMKAILLYLKDKGEISSKELSSQVHVSTRTIKSDMVQIAKIVKNYGAELKAKRGYGYSLKIYDIELFAPLNDLLNQAENANMMEVPKTMQERIAYLIRKLLMVDYPLKLDELADEVFVSRQTINGDLKEVRKLLSNYELGIHSGNDGIIIKGDEIQKRRCINESFFQNNEAFFVQDNMMFSSDMNQKEIRFVREALLHVLNEYAIRFSDLSIQNMVIHIMIAIRRYQFYQYVHFDTAKRAKIMKSVYYDAAKSLKGMLENQFHVVLPDDEIIYLAIHIQSKAIVMNVNQDSESAEEIEELLYAIYRRIKKRFHISLFLNQELNEFLKLHIPAMVERIRNKLYMRNPLLFETMRHYQYAVEICMEAAYEIEQWFDIKLDENEFAYLVLYFNLALSKIKKKKKRRVILICGHGRPEMILTLNQLNEKFASQIQDIITLDIYELPEFDFHHDDILIATIPISLDIEVPFIYIHGHLENFYDEIYEAFSHTSIPYVDMRSLIRKEYFFTNLECNTQEDVLISLANLLASEMRQGISNSIMNGICLSFSEVGNGCVILHTLYDLAIPCVAIMLLKAPVLWNHSYISTVVFCNVSVLEYSLIEQIYQKISQWCEKDHRYIKNYEQLIKSFE